MSAPAPRHSPLITKHRVTVVTWLHDDQVGYLDFVYRLKALAATHALTIISRRPFDDAELTVNAKVEVYRPRQSGTTLGMVWYWWQAVRHLRAHPSDLVLHLCSHTAAVANLPVGAPQVIYWNEHPSHYLDSPHLLRRWVTAALRALQYRGARKASLVMPIGEALREDLLANGCRASQLSLIPMGVADWFADPHPATAPAEGCKPLRVVYTGSIHIDRGRDIMIDAVSMARRAGVDVQLTLIGAHAQQGNDCIERAALQGVSAFVTVLPRIPGDQIPRHLAQADFGVCLWADKPYWRYNPPTKLFEYLVAGLPVLASNIRTHTAYLQDGQDGYIFDYCAESLAATFARAWAERERWPQMRQAAAQHGRPYRWSEIEPQFLGTLGALLR